MNAVCWNPILKCVVIITVDQQLTICTSSAESENTTTHVMIVSGLISAKQNHTFI